MGKWTEVAKIGSPDPSSRLRMRHVHLPDGGSYTAVEIYETGEEDVTSECTVKLMKSRHSEGYYCGIFHNGRNIVALGIDEASKCIVDPPYRIKKAKAASISFRIIKDK